MMTMRVCPPMCWPKPNIDVTRGNLSQAFESNCAFSSILTSSMARIKGSGFKLGQPAACVWRSARSGPVKMLFRATRKLTAHRTELVFLPLRLATRLQIAPSDSNVGSTLRSSDGQGFCPSRHRSLPLNIRAPALKCRRSLRKRFLPSASQASSSSRSGFQGRYKRFPRLVLRIR